MKGALCGLFASTLLIMAGAGEGWAQKTRRVVVVEQFQGEGADKLRQAVQSALSARGFEVVPDKKVASTEADLGLLSVADNYAAVAKELKAHAFVSGSLSGKGRLTARVRAKDANGGSLGDESWTGPNQTRLLSAVEANLAAKLEQLLGGGAAAEPVAAKAAPAPEPAAAARSEEGPRRRASDDDAPGREEHAVAASGRVDTADGQGPTGLDALLGVHAYSRSLKYTDKLAHLQKAPTQEYSLPAAPAVTLALDYFFHENVGLSASAEYSVALFSKEKRTFADGTSDEYIYRTSSYGFSIGAKGRYVVGPAEITAGVGYAKNAFKVVPEEDDDTPPKVVGVDYGQVKAGAGVRLSVSDTFALFGGGNYLHLLSMGEMNSEDYFPYATGLGGEGHVGAAFGVPQMMNGLEVRLALNVRRYVFAMNSDPTDERIAGGAVDQYLGLTVGVGYRPR